MVQVHVEILVAAVGLLLSANGAFLTLAVHLLIRISGKVQDLETSMKVDRAVRGEQQ